MTPLQARRVAALYDVHGNLPALKAVLDEVAQLDIDLIVFGGDVAAGPMPLETIAHLRSLGDGARFIRGNADRIMVSQFDGGADSPPQLMEWAATQIGSDERDVLASFPEALVVDIAGVGPVRFCHGSPRSDEEIVTRFTSDERLRPILQGVAEQVVVCGHTHVQFDRRIDQWRIVNAGSVGMAYERPLGARWLLLGPEIEHRTTLYDIDEAATELAHSAYPDIATWIDTYLRNPTPADEASRHFEDMAVGQEGA